MIAATSALPDVLIVGGGVIGLSIAEALVAEGARVRLLEAETVAAGASGAAAGMLAPIGEAALDSPLLWPGLESLQRFGALCSRLHGETGIDPEYVRSGLLHVARRGSEVEALAARLRATQAAARTTGWPFDPELEWLEGSALDHHAEGLDPELAAGIFSPHEGHLRPPLLVRALEASARSRGVRIDVGIRAQRLAVAGDRVLGVESSAGRIHAGVTVLALGAWTPALLETGGSAASAGVAIEPVRGQILCLEAPLPALRSICWSSGIYLVPKRDGSWIVGATEERVGFDRRVTVEGVSWLLDQARRVFPGLKEASFSRAWAGIRPVSADGLPSVGPVPGREGLLIAAGHGRNGVLLAPITAEIITDLWQGRAVGPAGRTLSPARSRPASDPEDQTPISR